MRTITLELVRHGPAHNQLLSPLTQYLALCENHPAVTLQLPLDGVADTNSTPSSRLSFTTTPAALDGPLFRAVST